MIAHLFNICSFPKCAFRSGGGGDPAAYVMGQPAVAEAFAAAEQDPTLLPDAIARRLAAQEALGIKPEDRRFTREKLSTEEDLGFKNDFDIIRSGLPRSLKRKPIWEYAQFSGSPRQQLAKYLTLLGVAEPEKVVANILDDRDVPLYLDVVKDSLRVREIGSPGKPGSQVIKDRYQEIVRQREVARGGKKDFFIGNFGRPFLNAVKGIENNPVAHQLFLDGEELQAAAVFLANHLEETADQDLLLSLVIGSIGFLPAGRLVGDAAEQALEVGAALFGVGSALSTETATDYMWRVVSELNRRGILDAHEDRLDGLRLSQ